MNCNICDRGFSARRKAFCTSCTKATLYTPRIEQAASLLSREKAHTHAEAIVRPGNDGVLAALPEDADLDAIEVGIKTHSFERAKAEKEDAEVRIRDITERAEQLRRDIEAYRASATSRREANERRRKDLDEARAEVEKQNARRLEPPHAAIRKARHRLNKMHSRTVEAREYLCKEASALSGLMKVKSLNGRTQYMLSGIPLPNLKDLNGINGRIGIEDSDQSSGNKALVEPYELISASLDNVCRFIGICCHYLSVRLPAEIILPRNNFPHAAIVSLNTSYRISDPIYPASASSQAASPAASRISLRHDLARPRLLQLDRPLPQLQKEDPKAAGLFIEGVSLLAYNIAWLCQTQGAGPFTPFEDVCEIGRNLYQLFPGKDGKSRPALNRNISTATEATQRSTTNNVAIGPRLGTYSHGGARLSLAGYESDILLSEFKLSVLKFTDQLRSYLRSELARAEWHIVDDTEWDEELEEERPVFVGGSRRPASTMSVMTIKPSDGDDDAMGLIGAARGNSGWMKVRGRVGEN